MGDESLFVPTGNVVAIFWVLIAVFVVRTGWRTRALAILLALVAVALPHLMPSGWLAWLPDDPRAAFMLGFLPPLGTAALVLRLGRLRERAQ
jgi:hypothetical protein